uniref:UDP-glucuronosyltransferase n=1 Tax=Megaselia scalaris TaxID=36166 RepID=T1GW28_MEGSC
VLWKWDATAPVPGNSPNILYKPWTPQDDILAHPNVKMFISHGGQGGVVESQYHGVPLLVIPFFGDQKVNRDSVESQGFGRGINFNEIDEESFKKLVLEVLENPSYSQKIKNFSKLYRDRPMTAKQTAIYWVEYVLRHKGAPHLQIIPFFGDQKVNRDSVESQGFGRGINFNEIDEESFKKLVLEVLENPSYSQKIKNFSKLYRDRPMTAKQTAIYWVEYVLRHKGAPHLQSPLVHLNFLERNSLDVLAVIFTVLALIGFILFASLKFIVKKLCGSKKHKHD